jgi:hypothetical protein
MGAYKTGASGDEKSHNNRTLFVIQINLIKTIAKIISMKKFVELPYRVPWVALPIVFLSICLWGDGEVSCF